MPDKWRAALRFLFSLSLFLFHATAYTFPPASSPKYPTRRLPSRNDNSDDGLLESLVSNMTIPELVLQVHLMFGSAILGPNSDFELYNFTMQYSPEAAIGVMHDWYPINKSHFNEMQKFQLDRARHKIPMMHYGECNHGVGSFKQSMFPQNVGMAASFDTDIVYRVGRAIAAEARSIGVHACLSPVLDLGRDPRWGRVQEAFGEDVVLTTQMGVAYASGLSKNGSWSDQDAVTPVMKHFAAHGSPQGGENGAPFMGLGNRQVLEEMLIPFRAAVELGGAKGVMMSYNEIDDVPSHVNPVLYNALDDWGFDGFVTADDTGMRQLQTGHMVASSPADAIRQWFTAGGMVQFYDYSLQTYIRATEDLVNNGSLSLSILQERVRNVLRVKQYLGLFDNPYIAEDVDPMALTASHVPLTLEAAQKSMVLLENRNDILPLKLNNTKRVALVGPFADILNYGDYSGQFGMYPITNSTTIRQAMSSFLAENASSVELVTSWGANSWDYNGQYAIPPYLLSPGDGTTGGMSATYYADTNFSNPLIHTIETPARDWGLYPPPGLPSVNWSATWEGTLTVPVSTDVDGWIGVAVSPNTTAQLYVDGHLISTSPYSRTGNLLGNIPGYTFTQANSTIPPNGGAPFKFTPGAKHEIRIQYQAYNTYQKIENESSLNAEIMLFWNLVDPKDAVQQAVNVAHNSDLVVLAVGAAWNSDGEGGDKAKLGLGEEQAALADAIFDTGKPVIMVLEGGRPFAIPEYYNKSAAVISAHFPGQSGGQAISDVIFGKFNPGGRLSITVPVHSGQLPVCYSYKASVKPNNYVDMTQWPQYPFGYGLSYTTFHTSNFAASPSSFKAGDTITFTVDVTNNGTMAGSYVAQVYLLQRVSSITRPVKQLVAFQRVYLDAGETATASLDLEVNRFLPILDRAYEWDLETGPYTFALLEHGGHDADLGVNVTLACQG